MIYALEAWSSGDLEPHIYWEESPTVEIKEFTQADDARRWAWEKLRQGFLVRLWTKPDTIHGEAYEF